MKTRMLALTLALLLPALLLGQWSSNPAVNNGINTAAGEQAIPKVVTGPDSYTYIGFFSNEGGNYNVRLQRLDPQGNPQWASGGILVSSHPQMTWLTDWDMTVDNANHAILAFQDIRNGGNNNVVVYRIASDGSFSWGADGIALSNSTAFDASPKVVSTSAGNAVFAWQADDVIILQKVDPSGNLLWGANGITLSSADTYSWPQLLPVGTDEVILKYFHDTGPAYAPTRHVYAQRYNASGNGVWSSPAVISNAAGISAWTQVFPFINDGSDGFYIAWHDDRDNDMNSSVFVQHISSTGTILFQSNGIEAATLSNRERMYAQLALPPGSADVYVLWNEMDADQNQRGIYGQKMSSSGTRLWTNNGMAFVNLSPNDVIPIALRHSPTDVVAFYEESSGGMDYHVKAMRIDNNGAFVWSPGIKTMCSVNSSKVHSVTNEYDNNQWIASWEDDRSGNSDIYAQNIQLDGTLGPYSPQTGFITGNVSLVGGNGDVTEAEVRAGNEVVHPDAAGNYSLEVLFGTYDVTASLQGYYGDTVFNVSLAIGQTLTDIDLTLNALPTGFISGNVSLVGGSGDVTQVEVHAGPEIVNPDNDGNYQLETWIGNYDVYATLATYENDTVFNVDVLDGQTTTGIDFSLEWVSNIGYIEGIVELQGGGDPSQATVTADTVSVNPDASGYYMITIPAGTYDVMASLGGYLTQTQGNITVDTGLVTTDVDFFLYLAPNTGYIEGYVTLVNGTGDVTQAEVWAGNQMDHPASDGFYHLAVSEGTYTVSAMHPYAMTDSITEVVVTSGSTTGNINFNLEIIRADLVCKAYDIVGNILNNVDLEIYGPEDTLTGTIANDSLIFTNVPYGTYEGWATYPGQDPVFATDELSADNHSLVFTIDITSVDETAMKEEELHIFPNPFSAFIEISLKINHDGNCNLIIVDIGGRPVRTLYNGMLPSGINILQWDGKNDDGQEVSPGIYLLLYQTAEESCSRKVIKH